MISLSAGGSRSARAISPSAMMPRFGCVAKAPVVFSPSRRGAGWRDRSMRSVSISEQFECLWPATAGRRVSKTRYEVPVGALTAELDQYSGELAGLMTVEVEFPSVEEAWSSTRPSGSAGNSPKILATPIAGWRWMGCPSRAALFLLLGGLFLCGFFFAEVFFLAAFFFALAFLSLSFLAAFFSAAFFVRSFSFRRPSSRPSSAWPSFWQPVSWISPSSVSCRRRPFRRLLSWLQPFSSGGPFLGFGLLCRSGSLRILGLLFDRGCGLGSACRLFRGGLPGGSCRFWPAVLFRRLILHLLGAADGKAGKGGNEFHRCGGEGLDGVDTQGCEPVGGLGSDAIDIGELDFCHFPLRVG